MDSQTALSQIIARNNASNPMSVQELRSLAASVDVNAGNSTLLLFSGGVGNIDPVTGRREFGAGELAKTLSNNGSVKTIVDVEIGKFLQSNTFQEALTGAALSEGASFDSLYLGIDSSGNRINNISFWDQASDRLVNQHTGDYRLIMPDIPAGSVADATEIPRLLSKSIVAGQEVNGISLQDWQARYNFEKILHGETQIRAEINSLIEKTSNADIADLVVGKDTNGVLHINTAGSFLGEALGLNPSNLPSGVQGTRISSLPDMDFTATDLATVGKYTDLLNKAGIVGDILGATIVVAKTTAEVNAGRYDKAGEIIAEYAGEITGGLAGGAALASLATGLLLIPGVNVGVVTGMVITGAAGLVGGYYGGETGGKFFKDVYNGVSDLGIVPYAQYLADNIEWSLNNPNYSFEKFLAGFKTSAQLKSEFNLGNINDLLSQTGNEWIQDRQSTLNDGTRLFNFRDGDRIVLPPDPLIPQGAVSILRLGISVNNGSMSYGYSFHDSNGNYLGSVPPKFFNTNKISNLSSGQISWSKNNDGSFSPQTKQTIEQSRQATADRYSEAQKSGIDISSSSSVQSNGTGYKYVTNSSDRSVTNGRLFTTVEEKESSASGQIIQGGRSVTTIREYDSDNLTLLTTTRVTSFKDSSGKTHNVIEYQEGQNGNWVVQEGVINLSGNMEEGELFVVPNSEFFNTLQALGSTAGSMLADYLADGNVYKSIVYKALLPTITENFITFSEFLSAGYSLDSLVRAAMGENIPNTPMDQLSFSKTFYKNLNQSVSSALGKLIVDEVGDALGLEGVAGEVFSVVGSSVTVGVASEAFDFIFKGLQGGTYGTLLNNGFNFDAPVTVNGQSFTVGEYIKIQALNALGGYVGSQLAGEVVKPESQTAALFGAAGSAIGTMIATETIVISKALTSVFQSISQIGLLGGPLGVAIGAFVGQVFGTILGNLFGDEDVPAAWARVGYDSVDKKYEIYNYGTSGGGSQQTATGMANQMMEAVNQILQLTGGKLRTGSNAANIQIGYEGNTFKFGAIDGELKSFDNPSELVAYAAFKLLKDFDLTGGHAVIMRAWHNSDAENLFEFREDLQVAEAFQNYLLNPTSVLALMMDQPDSTLAQSWAKVLQRAAELELHLPNGNDFDGGWGEILAAQGVDPSLIPTIQGNDIVMTDPVTGKQSIVKHVIGPGYEIVRIEGTNGDDVVTVTVDGPSVAYIDVGSGDDVVIGSEGPDIILAGPGNDTVNALGGNDWVHGGSGNDSVHGGNGDDLLIGGDDSDSIYGDEGNDQIYGNGGDDIIYAGSLGTEYIYGGQGNDTLYGNGYSVFFNPSQVFYTQLHGGEGNDILLGYNHNILYGGEGNDEYRAANLTWSYGNTFVISRNGGHDTVYGATNEVNTIQFDYSISYNELYFTRSGSDLKILILGEDQSVTVKGFYAPSNVPKIRIEAHAGIIYMDTREQILNAVANDATIPVAASGQYNYLSDANIIAGTHDTEFNNSVWNMSHQWFLWGSDEGATLYSQNNKVTSGGAGNDNISSNKTNGYQLYYGDSGNDTIYGKDLGDVLVGGLGNDYLNGGTDNDTLYGGHGDDALYGDNQNDVLDGGAGNDYLDGGENDDSMGGGDGNDILSDSIGKNSFSGGAGDDTISAITATDGQSMSGGEGNDTVNAGLANDTINGGAGNDTLNGNGGDDWINGDDGNDTIYGGSGNDLINGGADDDLIYTDAGNDSIEGGAGVDTVTYAASTAGINLSLITRVGTGGDAQGDTVTGVENIIGTGFNDTIEGSIENNTLTAGAGVDTLSYANTGAGITVSLALTTAQNTFGAGLDTVTGFENLTGSAFADTLIGDGNANILIGGEGDDVMEGGAGNDTINGGAGDDTARYTSATSAVTVSLALTTAQNTGGAGTDTLSAIQNLIGSNFNDTLTGDTTGNIIEGGAGNDILNGGAGTDTVSYAGAASGVTVNLTLTAAQNTIGAGSDTITAFESILGSNFNDTLTGDANNNVIEGGGGNDVMDGGSATDTVSYSRASAAVTVNLGLTTAQNTIGAGTDTILNIERINGSSFNDTLTGNTSNNQIDGGDGNDLMDGGLGWDTLSYLSAKRAVTVSLSVSEAQNTGGAGTDTIISFENLSGSNFNDTLIGNALNNTLRGANGDDVLDGGAGDDALTGDAGLDTASYQSAASAVTVNLSITTAQNTLGAGTDTITTIENLTGSSFNDVLIGDAGNNILKGGIGNDILEGGLGDDQLLGEGGSDTARYSAATAAVAVSLAVLTAQNTGAAGNDTLGGIENLIGSGFNDTLTGDGNANIIEGGLGNDILNGGLGVDTVSYAAASAGVSVNLATTTAQNTVGAGSDTISNFENILGSGFNDTLTGDGNTNIIEGGLGNDILNGAAGIDTASYAGATFGVTVNLSTTTAQNTVGAGSDTLTNFENLMGSAFNDTLTGTSGDNIIDGGAGNDTIQGAMGNDILIGGSGVDTLSFAGISSAVTINLALTTAQNTGGAGIETISGFENILGSGSGDSLTGDAWANLIDGAGGSDTIEGGLGDDILIGGSGTDTASYAAAASGVTVSLLTTTAQNTGGAGTDTLSGFERLTGSAFADVLIGDGLANRLTGGEGDDILEGGAGDDELYGNNGFDTARYSSATSAVTVSLALSTAQNTIGAGTDTLSSIQALIGSNFNDTLTGSANDDTIEGGLGNDVLSGGAGNDTLSYASASAAVTVNLATTTAQNTGGAGTDTISGFEHLFGSGFNDWLMGDGNSNVIEGGLGNDIIDGAAGTDTASYRSTSSGVTVNLNTTTAQNTIGAGTDTITNMERIIGSNFNDTLTGNSGTNQIEGGLGNDIMDGGAGTDTLSYQSALSGVTVNLAITAAQNTVGAGVDTISNFESITGSGFNDTLYGNAGVNTLRGGNGNDTLFGAAGADNLYGEAGADIFVFDGSTAFSGIDTVFDFALAQGDKLNIASVLVGYNPLQSLIDNFVTFTVNGANTTFAVDRDGTGTTYTSQTIATLNAVTGLDADTLLLSGNLVVV